MNSAKISGYGIKVTAGDSLVDIKNIATNFGKVNPLFTDYLQPSLRNPAGDATFSSLAFSFQRLVEEEFPLLEFVFLAGPELSSFAIVTKDSSTEVLDGVNPISEYTYNDFYDSLMMRRWTKDFLPGREYDVDWIFEDIHPDSAGKWKDKASK